ncbi:uncharacterized protein ACLA_089920 [Aspergillus clavatus NRRL 1]|uniref:Uncharacterized protein n=1 Tax=Aspergillus clavatus (strain ATCC 1007 / CBS 513.65 / DSM 816 / NCTC 3887 / NRRL 1 / QM 1276 / 107) TaxID=344612 RepID=A1CEK0_ASPCL|nr:uncharacterized protein ACLA_089920 [Aspergillus clavatus NRRL 1]EAW11299.1 conserved hypothetical protein [Aspergillus clavatus NRRL 1]
MPTSNTSSPVKRPGLARRALSSHAVVTRTSSDSSDTYTSTANTTQKALAHRPRAHVVGGGHRTHGRNPSFGKNLNKLQRHTSAGHIATESTIRHHQRKKSAPATPIASPRGGHHVRWDSGVDASQAATSSIKRNNSSPALRNPRRNSSSVLAKKALVTDRPHTSSGKKKTVGFELGDSDQDEEGEWEDTTQSPESTRRGSVAQSRDSVDNTAVLVDPLTFVKRPYPQTPRAASSLPESAYRSFSREDHSSDEDEQQQQQQQQPEQQQQQPQQEQEKPPSDFEERKEEVSRVIDHTTDITARLLSPSHSARAPPAMSSISATVKPAPVDTISRNASLTNIAGHDGLRRPLSSSTTTLANTPGGLAHGTSSSMEGGVSRFIINNKTGVHASSLGRTDSDPNTPSSFLPHYHPQTPPSPNRGTRRAKASPPSRPPGAEPPSRTQQKLWLQRTAALNTSPPDTHGISATVSPAARDPVFVAGTHGRAGSAVFDAGRALVNGSSRTGGDTEAKHIRKAYEKTALELTVVRRFQSPTGNSFARLAGILNDSKAPASSSHERTSSLGKPIKSAPALTQLQQASKQQRDSASPEPRQLLSRKTSDLKNSVSQTYLDDVDDAKSQHPAQRILSTSDEAAHGTSATGDDFSTSYLTSESDLMIRRMWESREVATSG